MPLRAVTRLTTSGGRATMSTALSGSPEELGLLKFTKR
jgi:hypothetical protein